MFCKRSCTHCVKKCVYRYKIVMQKNDNVHKLKKMTKINLSLIIMSKTYTSSDHEQNSCTVSERLLQNCKRGSQSTITFLSVKLKIFSYP